MDETLMRMLDEDDGEPNMPFYFVWANEAFVWKWKKWSTGRVAKLQPNEVQVPQQYPKEGWRPHYDYLRQFFRHRNYYKINGKPVLAVFYNEAPEKVSQQVPAALFNKYKQWALEDGFPGIHILQWFHGKQLHKGTSNMDISAFSTRKRGMSTVAEWADSVQDF